MRMHYLVVVTMYLLTTFLFIVEMILLTALIQPVNIIDMQPSDMHRNGITGVIQNTILTGMIVLILFLSVYLLVEYSKMVHGIRIVHLHHGGENI